MKKLAIGILYIFCMICLCSCTKIEDMRNIIDQSTLDELFNTKFNESESEGNENVKLDLSSVIYGYIAISAYSDKRLKLQVTKDSEVYTYDIDSGGIPSILPLQCGNGTYSFRVLESVDEERYADIYFAEQRVTMIDEFQPYLRPSDYVNYTEDSDCIQKARELAQEAENKVDIIKNIHEFIKENIVYDNNKASKVKTGYLPDPDSTLKEGKGICFDYASLTAAMLRSQGIPTKVIFGYVEPDNEYHAWNMFYTEETGWITAEYSVRNNDWNRLDITFAVTGAKADFINNDNNYMDVYLY